MIKRTKKFGVLALLTVAVLVIGVVLISRYVKAPEETPPEVITPPLEEARPEPGSVPAVHFSKLIPFLPDPPSGWVGEEPSGTMMTFDEWSWSTAERHYTKPGTYTGASIKITDGEYSWMIYWDQFFEYETTDGYLKSTSFKGYPAWEEHTKPDSYTLWVGIDDRFVVIISVHESDRDTLYAFADRVDYRGIAALK